MSKVNGKDITEVFTYVQKVFHECQQLIYKTDNLMAPNWKSIYGSRITRDVTSSLYDPDRWLVEAIFRIYYVCQEKFRIVKKVIIELCVRLNQLTLKRSNLPFTKHKAGL